MVGAGTQRDNRVSQVLRMEGPLEISFIAEECPSLNMLNEMNEVKLEP